MKRTIEYFHTRVKDEIESWPDGILADYARLVELLMELDQTCGCRIPAPWATGCLSCGPVDVKASDALSTVILTVNE